MDALPHEPGIHNCCDTGQRDGRFSDVRRQNHAAALRLRLKRSVLLSHRQSTVEWDEFNVSQSAQCIVARTNLAFAGEENQHISGCLLQRAANAALNARHQVSRTRHHCPAEVFHGDRINASFCAQHCSANKSGELMCRYRRRHDDEVCIRSPLSADGEKQV